MDRRRTPSLLSILLGFAIFLRAGLCANPNYSYQVNIEDPNEANFQQKGETRLGEKAEGFYSVLDPDGRLRTVTYVSDEFGFRPTVTYTYPKVLQYPQNHLPLAPVLKQPLPLYTAAGATPLVNGLTSYPQPFQYAASYGTPVFTVKEARHFYKTAPPAFPLGVAPQVFQAPPVHKHVIKAQPPTYIYKATPPVTPLVVSPAILATPVLQHVIKAQPPPPTPVAIAKAPELSGYTYPVPEVKLEYPPPPEVKLEYPPPPEVKLEYPPPPEVKLEYPPPPPPKTPAPPVIVETTQAPAATGGYAYPVPEKKLEYPQEDKAGIHATTIAPVEISPPPVVPVVESVVQAVPPKEEEVAVEPVGVSPLPQPIPTRVVQAQPPQAFQYIRFGTRIPAVQKQIVYPVAPQQVVLAHQPIVYHQPKIQYTQNPAQVFHRQLHFPRLQQHVVPQVIQAVAPAPSPAFVHALPPPTPLPLVEHKYEDIVTPNLNVMRYGSGPVVSYLPLGNQIEEVSPVAVGVIPKGRTNPLTFNYGYDNGISKVSHSYYGSGW